MVFSQSTEDTIDCQWLLKSSDFIVVKTVQEIAPWVLVKFPEWEKMSNPGKRFNSGNKGRGLKERLFFAAYCDDNWIVSYEQGGSAYKTHCFIITVNEQNRIAVLHSFNEFKTMDALKSFALTDIIPFVVWKEHDY